MTAPQVVLLIAAFVLTYVVGFFTGRIVTHRNIEAAQEVVVELHKARTWISRFASGPYAMFVAFVALLAVGVQSLISSSQHNADEAHSRQRDAAALSAVKAQADCFQRFADQLYATLQPSREQGRRYRAADEKVNTAILNLLEPGNDTSDIASIRAATLHKKHVADVLNRENRIHPIPQPPRKACPK